MLVWDKHDKESVEFVQVKAENPNQLWTPTFLCQRDKKRGETARTGTSVPERSLARDCCCEEASFRIVTSWELNSELQILKLVRSHRDRANDRPEFRVLLKQINEKIGDFRSKKGHGCDSWLERVLWEVESQEKLEQVNCLGLLKVMERMGLPLATDSAEIVYNALLTVVKQAAEKPDTEREKKFLLASDIRDLVKKQAAPYPGLGPCETLENKLSDARLPETERQTAQDLRRAYLMAVRTRSYLETGGVPTYANAILHQLLRLRTERDSGQLTITDGVHFHALCLSRVNELMATLSSKSDNAQAELGAGCMYDITARCRHRFTRVNE